MDVFLVIVRDSILSRSLALRLGAPRQAAYAFAAFLTSVEVEKFDRITGEHGFLFILRHAGELFLDQFSRLRPARDDYGVPAIRELDPARRTIAISFLGLRVQVSGTDSKWLSAEK